MDGLPPEIIIHITTFLSASDQYNFMACNRLYNELYYHIIISRKWFNQANVLDCNTIFIDKINKMYNIDDPTKIPKWCTHVGLTSKTIHILPESVEYIYVPSNISYTSKLPPHFKKYKFSVKNHWLEIKKIL